MPDLDALLAASLVATLEFVGNSYVKHILYASICHIVMVIQRLDFIERVE